MEVKDIDLLKALRRDHANATKPADAAEGEAASARRVSVCGVSECSPVWNGEN